MCFYITHAFSWCLICFSIQVYVIHNVIVFVYQRLICPEYFDGCQQYIYVIFHDFALFGDRWLVHFDSYVIDDIVFLVF